MFTHTYCNLNWKEYFYIGEIRVFFKSGYECEKIILINFFFNPKKSY